MIYSFTAIIGCKRFVLYDCNFQNANFIYYFIYLIKNTVKQLNIITI